MKLITFQTKSALAVLKKTGVLRTDADKIDLKKYGVPYKYIVENMKKHIKPGKGESYPLWAWAKCGASISPKKRKNFDGRKQDLVKITFEKPAKEVFLTDYMAYSFILSGHIVPKTKAEYRQFLQKMDGRLQALKDYVRQDKTGKSVAKLFPEIEKTWARILNLKSNVHQACVWNIKMSEVQKIEPLNDRRYLYGSMNHKRADGSRPDWKKRYLDFLSK